MLRGWGGSQKASTPSVSWVLISPSYFLGQLKGADPTDLCPSKRKEQAPEHKPAPTAPVFTRMSYRPLWASMECPLSSGVCHYLLDWFTLF